jgi:hypothetical protein
MTISTENDDLGGRNATRRVDEAGYVQRSSVIDIRHGHIHSLGDDAMADGFAFLNSTDKEGLDFVRPYSGIISLLLSHALRLCAIFCHAVQPR